jgi:hypothetical protein
VLNTSFIASVAERDIDFLVLEELSVNDVFRAWFAERALGQGVYGQSIGAWHSICDGDLGESDLVFGLKSVADKRIAVLIENKIGAIAQPRQGERYRARGERGIQGGHWDEFRTCLLAPQRYLSMSASVELYDAIVSYEEMAAFFTSAPAFDERYLYKAKVINEAIEQNRRGYQAEISDAMTAFVTRYYDFAIKNYPDLRPKQIKPRPRGGDWIMFEPLGLPSGVKLCHQLGPGAVKLLFSPPETLESLQIKLAPYLREDMSIRPAGKSVGLSLDVPKVSPLDTRFEAEHENILKALTAARKLFETLVAALRDSKAVLG